MWILFVNSLINKSATHLTITVIEKETGGRDKPPRKAEIEQIVKGE